MKKKSILFLTTTLSSLTAPLMIASACDKTSQKKIDQETKELKNKKEALQEKVNNSPLDKNKKAQFKTKIDAATKDNIASLEQEITEAIDKATNSKQESKAFTKDKEAKKRELDDLIKNVEITLKKGIEKENVFASEVKYNDFSVSELGENIYLRLDGQIISDDTKGVLIYKFYLDSNVDDKVNNKSEWVKSFSREIIFDGFKSHQKIINQAVEQISVTIKEEDKAKILPSDFVQVDANFTFSNISDKYKLIISKEADDTKGIVTIKYHLEDKATKLVSKTIEKKVDGFLTLLAKNIAKEKERLNTLINETQADTLLLEGTKERLKASKVTTKDFKNTLADAKINVFDFVADDENGKLTFKYHFISLKSNLGSEKIVSEAKSATLEGFITNEQYKQKVINDKIAELDEKIQNATVTINDKNTTMQSSRLASEVEIKDINVALSEENITVEIINLIPDDQKGTITFVYIFKSKIEEFNTIVSSSKTKKASLSGYKTKEQLFSDEQKRLNILLAKIDTLFTKENIVKNAKLAKEITKDDFEDSELPNASLSIVSLSDVNDENGTLKVEFKLKSKLSNAANIESSSKELVIGGFLTKAQYLANLKAKYEEAIKTKKVELKAEFTSTKQKNEFLPSQISESDFNVAITSPAELIITSKTINAQDSTGKLSLIIKYSFNEDKFNTTNILSATTAIEFDGFLTTALKNKNDDIQKLNQLINEADIIKLKNEEDKNNKTSDEIKVEDLIINPDKQAQLVNTKLIITQLSPQEDGTLKVKFKLSKSSDKYEGEALSNEKEIELKFLSKDAKSIKEANELKMLTEANYLPANVYKKAEMEVYLKYNSHDANTTEISKILGFDEFLAKNNNLEGRVETFDFDRGFLYTDWHVLKYKFIFVSKKDSNVESKVFDGKINISSVIVKRNLQNYVDSCFDLKASSSMKTKLASFITNENFSRYIDNKYKLNNTDFILDNQSFMTSITKYNVKSYDIKGGSLTVTVIAELDGTTASKDYVVSGFMTGEEAEELQKKREQELERLNDAVDKLELVYKGDNQAAQLVDQVKISDFELKNASDAELVEVENREINSKEGTITFNVALKSKKQGLEDVKSTKSRKITISGFAKDKKEEYDKLYQDYKDNNLEYKNYKANYEKNLSEDIATKIKNIKPEVKDNVIAQLKKEYTDLTNAIEEAFVKSNGKVMQIFLQNNNDDELNKNFLAILNNMYVNTNEKLLGILMAPAANKDKAKDTLKARFIIPAWLPNWVLAQTVGEWAKGMFNEFANGMEQHTKYLNTQLEQLKTKHDFLNKDNAKFELVSKITINRLKLILDYYKELNFNYLFHGTGNNVNKIPAQDKYIKGDGGKRELLGSGWAMLFNTEKFFTHIISDNYYTKKQDDLNNELDTLVKENKLSQDEKTILFKEIKSSLTLFLKAVEIYSADIRNVLQTHLQKNIENIIKVNIENNKNDK
ncbi:lipoprotein 17-related variable surface protein [Mycoplasmopsis opalescens]|uniref:lipoprotein 17-related variable surface protein n=1 Tax=Mycoplasmopsis opalescens TaxID=114886 RepID=UPI0004A6EF5D|nr:lipoprotein 17-related variable surface protein [Mycoplasmopsis opalescens]